MIIFVSFTISVHDKSMETPFLKKWGLQTSTEKLYMLYSKHREFFGEVRRTFYAKKVLREYSVNGYCCSIWGNIHNAA